MNKEHSISQKVFYHGDMANRAGKFEVTKIETTKFGTNLILSEIDGEGREFNIRPHQISEKYAGHGGTRFVTWEAYLKYQEERQKQLDQMLAKLNKKGEAERV